MQGFSVGKSLFLINHHVLFFLGGAEPREARKLPQSVFGQENLTDCGFSKELLEHFCNPDPARIQVLENLKFSNDVYSWT